MTWPTARLSDVAAIRHGGTPSKKEQRFWNGDIPWVSPKDMGGIALTDTEDHITADGVACSATSVMPANSIFLVARSGVLAHSVPIALARRPMAFNQDIKAISVDPARLDAEYALWCLRSQQGRILVQGVKRGATVHSLHSGFIENLAIPLPPLDEQRRIVDILNRANGIRRLRREALDKTRQLIPALFVDMFGDRYQWTTQTIGEVLADRPGAIRTGPFGSQLRHSEFVEEGIPVLGIDNVVTNRFRWTRARCLPEDRFQMFKRFRVFPSDVIVTIMGTAGRACVVPDDISECMSTKHLCVLSLNHTVVHPVYIWGSLLYDRAVRSQTRLESRGAIMEGWNMSIVRNLRLSVPPLALQQVFAERVADIQATIAQQERMAEASEQLVAVLMARLFDGAASRPDGAAALA